MPLETWTRTSRRTFLKATAVALVGIATGSWRALAQGSAMAPLRIGVILPIPTGTTAPTDTIGSAAEGGAKVAEGVVGNEAAKAGLDLKVLLASSPTPAAAVRAAERMVATENIAGLVGGVGPGQAAALSATAKNRGVLFFNVGSPDDALRGSSCQRTTFHVEASDSMYLDATTSYFAAAGKRRWFFVYPDTPAGRALHARAVASLERRGDGSKSVGDVAIPPGPQPYGAAFSTLRKAGPDVVMSLQQASDQDFFLGQYGSARLPYPVTGFPYPVTQTREYYGRFLQSDPNGDGPRATLWDPTLRSNGAGDLNDRFAGMSGAAMDPAAWATFAAIKILSQAVAATGTLATDALVAYLEGPHAQFDLDKGIKASFRPWDHQLRQPLYMVRLNSGAKLGVTVQDQLGEATVVERVPGKVQPGADASTMLDQLGVPASESRCSFGS